MSVPFPPLPSYLPADLPPLPPLTAERRVLVQREEQAATARGEKASKVGAALRERFDAMHAARERASEATPVPAPDGVWMIATDVDDTELWWAVRPLGSGQVEVWNGRSAPVTVRVTDLRPRPVRRSRVDVVVADGLPRTFRVGTDRGRLTDVGLPAAPWWKAGGNDPITAVVLLVAAIGVVVTFPWRLGKARARAKTRDALVAALRE